MASSLHLGNKSICFAFWQSDQYESIKEMLKIMDDLILNIKAERVRHILGCSVAHPALKTAQFLCKQKIVLHFILQCPCFTRHMWLVTTKNNA